jgi:hypothetical protein
MSGQPSAGTGAVYFPEPDVKSGGDGRAPPAKPAAGSLRGLPRQRRPAVLALAVAMAGAGVVISAALYQHADHQVPVVMVTTDVPPGAVVSARDLTATDAVVGPGIHVVPAAQLGQVDGEVAAVGLRAGTLLAPSDLTSAQPPGPGQQLVPVALKPSALPASGLFPGDRVLVVGTPGDQGQPGDSAGAQPLAAPVPAAVAAVNTAGAQAGFVVVDLLVSATDGPAVAEQASTGQFALIVTQRG